MGICLDQAVVENYGDIDISEVEDVMSQKTEEKMDEYAQALFSELEGYEKYSGEFNKCVEENFLINKKDEFIENIVNADLENRKLEFEELVEETPDQITNRLMKEFENDDLELENLIQEKLDEGDSFDEDDAKEEILYEKRQEFREIAEMEFDASLQELAEDGLTEEISQEIGDSFEKMMSYDQTAVEMDEEYKEYKDHHSIDLLREFMLENYKYDIFQELIDEIESEVKSVINNNFSFSQITGLEDVLDEKIRNYIDRKVN